MLHVKQNYSTLKYIQFLIVNLTGQTLIYCPFNTCCPYLVRSKILHAPYLLARCCLKFIHQRAPTRLIESVELTFRPRWSGLSIWGAQRLPCKGRGQTKEQTEKGSMGWWNENQSIKMTERRKRGTPTLWLTPAHAPQRQCTASSVKQGVYVFVRGRARLSVVQQSATSKNPGCLRKILNVRYIKRGFGFPTITRLRNRNSSV